jgi:hypothetical protein
LDPRFFIVETPRNEEKTRCSTDQKFHRSKINQRSTLFAFWKRLHHGRGNQASLTATGIRDIIVAAGGLEDDDESIDPGPSALMPRYLTETL